MSYVEELRRDYLMKDHYNNLRDKARERLTI